MDKLLGGLAVALVSGLAFLAYRHSRSYKRISTNITILSAVAYMLLLAYNAGITQTSSATRQVVWKSKLSTEIKVVALDVIEKGEQEVMPPMLMISVYYFAWMMYLLVLNRLPDWITVPEEPADGKQ